MKGLSIVFATILKLWYNKKLDIELMAHKTFTARFPIRKLHKKSVFKKQEGCGARQAGRGQKGISRREK